MASDYEKIKAENIRKYGEETHHLAFLGRLYTDRTHFVFELLQNAEDRNASRVFFRLFEDRLEVQHNGEIFDDRHVRGICGVCKGTSAEDLTKIGKFGIGFKAVYAYTSVPEIHSGDEHFCIEHYVRPSLASERTPGEDWTTLFVFAFDSVKVPAETASREIAARLRGLTARTLLFLRQIKEIKFVLPDGTHGIYLREEKESDHARLVTVIGESAGKEQSEKWLVYERPVPIPGETKLVRVEIAFRLEIGPERTGESIAKVRESPLYVFFPTEKMTQFGFLIQGPYSTTPARDNVLKDDEWNATLVNASAELIVDALYDVRERGLLTIAALNALPIRLEAFPTDGMFFPIVKSVRDALRTKSLLPAEDRTFVAASHAKLARGGDLRKLLGQEQLAILFPNSPETKWLSGEITQDRTPDLRAYLINELKIEELDPDGFARKISHSFLSAQSDEWFVSLYGYLSGQEALWRAPRWPNDNPGVFRSKPVLRLQDNTLVAPFRADGKANAYLPPPEGTDLPTVKKTIAEDEKAAAFLKRLGLAEPDVFDDIVDRVLPKYVGQTVSVSPEEHAADIHKIFRALASDSEAGKKKVLNEARKTPFLKACNCLGQTTFRRPGETYRDDNELRFYFEGFEDAWFVAEPFGDGQPREDAWDSLGIARRPRRIEFEGGLPPDIRKYSTRTEEVINYKLHGFDRFVEILTAETDFDAQKNRSLILWKYMAHEAGKGRSFFLGLYKWFYYSDKSRHFDSFMLTMLRDNEWVPTLDQVLKKPAGLGVSDLCVEFRDADELMEILGINGEDQPEAATRLKHAAELGVSLDDIEFLKQHPDDFQQWKDSVRAKAARPAFPVRTSADPRRREARVSEKWHDASVKEYDSRERSVRTSRTTVDPHPWLVDYYTNDEGQMVCQLCGDEMPFRKRDGQYYFEAMEALGREQFSREHEAQFLALCPVCAAKYNEFVKSDDETLAEMRRAMLASDEPSIPVMLGSSAETLRFVEVHFDDLKTILKEEEGAGEAAQTD